MCRDPRLPHCPVTTHASGKQTELSHTHIMCMEHWLPHKSDNSRSLSVDPRSLAHMHFCSSAVSFTVSVNVSALCLTRQSMPFLLLSQMSPYTVLSYSPSLSDPNPPFLCLLVWSICTLPELLTPFLLHTDKLRNKCVKEHINNVMWLLLIGPKGPHFIFILALVLVI